MLTLAIWPAAAWRSRSLAVVTSAAGPLRRTGATFSAGSMLDVSAIWLRGVAMEATIGVLLLIGAASIIAGITGGNVGLPGGIQFAALRNPALRVLLCVVGVGLFLISLGLYSERGTPSAQQGDERLAYANQLLPACERMNARLKPIEEIRPDASFEATAAAYRTGSSIIGTWVFEMAQVTPPPGDEAVVTRIYDHLELLAGAYARLANAYAVRDRDMVQKYAQEAGDQIRDYNAAAQNYGFRAHCLF